MYVMGLGGSIHDFSACILKDGQLLSYIEDERITRIKHGKGMGLEIAKGFSRKYCCDLEGIEMDEIDCIFGNDILTPSVYKRMPQKVTLIPHHLAHAASCYFLSPYEHSAILVVDSVGSKCETAKGTEYESVSIFAGEGNNIRKIDGITGKNISGTDNIENSLGVFYTIMTELAGFEEFQEGKLMGLAPYGTNQYYDLIKQHVRFLDNGKYEIKEQDLNALREYQKLIDAKKDMKEQFVVRADLAWAAQAVLEECILHMCRYVKELTGESAICLAGGVFLNSVTNYRLYKEGIFSNMFLQPACGDGGTALGSALYGYYSVLQNKRQ